jgi:UDP-N-acetylglucosamine--N-acetylmuramyl-(pentapeptide) pyrophosphoryl-undecaprenol N-acetylglucosamine transferase
LGLDNRPLIYAGVAGTLMEKKLLNKILIRIFKKFPEKYQVIMTCGIPDISDKPIFENKNIRIFNWVSDRYSIIKASDIVVSKAGHNTIAECFYYGKPTILIPTPAHSEHQANARSVEKMGVSKIIQQKNLNYETLLKNVQEVLSDNKIKKKMEKIKKGVSKINAVKSIMDKINYYINK